NFPPRSGAISAHYTAIDPQVKPRSTLRSSRLRGDRHESVLLRPGGLAGRYESSLAEPPPKDPPSCDDPSWPPPEPCESPPPASPDPDPETPVDWSCPWLFPSDDVSWPCVASVCGSSTVSPGPSVDRSRSRFRVRSGVRWLAGGAGAALAPAAFPVGAAVCADSESAGANERAGPAAPRSCRCTWAW